MGEASVRLRVAIVDSREWESQAICSLFELLPVVEHASVHPLRPGLPSVLRHEGVNALAINIFSVGVAEGISAVREVRDELPHVPICLLGTVEQLTAWPGVPIEWRERFGHYYRVNIELPPGPLLRDIELATDRFRGYLLSQDAQARLRDTRELLSVWEGHSLQLDDEATNRIRAAIDVAEQAIEERARVEPPSIVPGFADTDVQELIKTTIDRASRALDQSAKINGLIIAGGMALVIASFVVAAITKSWAAVAFGGFGISGVVASLVSNPLSSIGLGARRLVQVQVAYLGFLNQVRLLGVGDSATDGEDAATRSRQLSAATVEVLQALETYFGG